MESSDESIAKGMAGQELTSRQAGEHSRAGLRASLRDGTRERHERLDAAFPDLGAAAAGGSDYARFLRVNEACHRAIEPVLSAGGLGAHRAQLVPGDRHAAAAADLAAMNLRPIVLKDFVPRSPGLSEAVGIAYVMEGSRLGARTILKRLRASGRVDMRPPPPTLFLEAAGNADRFRGFMAWAETIAAAPSDRDLAVRAANATLDYFLEAVRIADTVPCDGGTI